MVLFLNFDGVLHPNAVKFDQSNTPALDAPGHRLFENSTALAQIAADFIDLRLILNTWWTYRIGLDACIHLLPNVLASRVTGSVVPHAKMCAKLPHRISLANEAATNSKDLVLILDHADARYPKHLLPTTFLLEPQVGLADSQAVIALRNFVAHAYPRA
jgi:hypothetical protein